MRAKVSVDISELLGFPKGWAGPDLDCDRPGREFNAGGIYLLVHANPEIGEPWSGEVFFGGDIEAVWTKSGFKSAAEARKACVNQGLRLLRECRDALQRADGR